MNSSEIWHWQILYVTPFPPNTELSLIEPPDWETKFNSIQAQ